MDGMEANDGIVILATTNHTENIDPAISDRPGRFDRIIEIPLPNNKQRLKIMENILLKMPSETIPRTTLTEISRKSEGLSGAWVREIVQSAFIEAIYQGRERLNAKDLQEGLADVLKRRGMAYQSTPNLAQVIESKNAEVYTM
jgi:proteasome regulatory subunit